MSNDVVYLIRHAEKPDDTSQGVTPEGDNDTESLIVQGWQRAGALAVFFGPSGQLPSPQQVYAAAAEKEKIAPHDKVGSKSLRPQETVSVLSSRLGKTTNTSFTKGEEQELVQHLQPLSGITLVCWQHQDIPTIASLLLGSSTGIPAVWPSNRFDVVWRFTRPDKASPWMFDQVCQLLLPGDVDQPIA